MRHTPSHNRLEYTPKAKQGGFTIIETLVAITILMIAVAGPLTVANQALHAALDARTQMIASNLAQETIEEIRNYKDNNITGSDLATIFGNFLDPDFSNPQFIVYANSNGSNGSYNFDQCSSVGNGTCSLYLSPDYGYTYESDPGTITPYQRWFTLAKIPDGSPNPNELMLTVTVQWVSNSVTNQIQIQDILSNTTR